MSVNRVILVGNVGGKPEKKNGSTSVTTFSLATHEERKGKNGEKIRRTEWHRIVTFGKLADICAEYLKKGREVYVEGSIRSSIYRDKDGQEKQSYDIIASEVKFIGPASPREKSDAPAEEEPVSDLSEDLVDL